IEVRTPSIKVEVVGIKGPRLAVRIFLPPAGPTAIVKRLTVSVRDLKLEAVTEAAGQSQIHRVIVRSKALENCAHDVKIRISTRRGRRKELNAAGQDRRNCRIAVSLAKQVAAARTDVGNQQNCIFKDLSLQVKVVLHDVRGLQVELHRLRNGVHTFEQRRI